MVHHGEPTSHPTRRWRIAAGVLLVLLTGSTVAVSGADAVIMPDGFVVQGRWFKETELSLDMPGRPVRITKANGFDVVEDGPKFVIFSSHAQRGGKVEKDVARPEYTAYTRKLARIGPNPLPAFTDIVIPPFDAKWNRTLSFKHPGGGENSVRQTLTHLDPRTMGIQSSTNAWRLMYHTAEWDPREIRKLLGTHPDLEDVGGKADPERRMNIAKFLLDAGWIAMARDELEKAKKDVPAPWAKEADQRFKELGEEADRAETRAVIEELEAAVAAGRYDGAKLILDKFVSKSTDPKDTNRLAVLKAEIEPVRSRFERAQGLLREAVERESGLPVFYAHASAVGPAAGLYHPRPKIEPKAQTLIEAASTVLTELHPDTVSRVELFTTLAAQEEDRRKKDLPPTNKPPELLALAVTGWLKGKNGAEANLESALRFWAGRQMSLNYLRQQTRNDRVGILDGYLATGKPLDTDELTQMITLLPPPFPEDLDKRSGEKVKPEEAGGVTGIHRRKTAGNAKFVQGAEYCLWLPPEYHHGRAYPVLIALHTPQVSPELMVAMLAQQASKHGYIVAAPKWCNQFGKTVYEYTGEDHPIVRETLRDLLGHFQVNPDKVFLYGYGEGANFAVDMGMAYPDLFAGVVAMGPNPPPQIFIEWWKNAQKLPVYMVTGELSGAFNNIRKLYEKWTLNGFPALLTVYKGRGGETFPLEQPRIFDWLGRKTRARGTASLRLTQAKVEPWQILRDGDDHRFYWVGVGEGGLTRPGWAPGKLPNPAQFRADIGRNGVITIDQAIGVRKFVIWVEKDLIDWEKEVRVVVNNAPALNYRPQKLKPDLRVLLEELYKTGDRKMLYLGKIEVDGPG